MFYQKDFVVGTYFNVIPISNVLELLSRSQTYPGLFSIICGALEPLHDCTP